MDQRCSTRGLLHIHMEPMQWSRDAVHLSGSPAKTDPAVGEQKQQGSLMGGRTCHIKLCSALWLPLLKPQKCSNKLHPT